MRVFLAVQVMSQGMLRLILRHAEKCDGISNYKGIIEIIKKVDRYVPPPSHSHTQTNYLN